MERLVPILQGSSIELKYLRSIRSLVLQRNVGIDSAKGDVVLFLDDDVVLDDEYLYHIIDVYRRKWNDRLGGVQGVIIENSTIGIWNPLQLISRMFLLPNVIGSGTLLVSANPAFRGDSSMLERVDIFSGCMMSFRRDILMHHHFDENFKEFWLFDDVELSYRISREYDLYQTPKARLHHNSSSPSYEGHGKIAKMSAVNRYYLFKKYLSHSKLNWIPFLWSSFGEALVNLLQSLKHFNFKPIRGLIEGWCLVLNKQIPYLR